MIGHVQPFSDIAAIAIERQGLIRQGMRDKEGQKLFGNMIRPVVVAGASDQDWQNRRCDGRPSPGDRGRFTGG